MRLTKQTAHAIRILVDCAETDGDLLKVAAISSRLDITKQNVFKIVHILSRAGFVAAVRGPNGGVRLARPATSIRIGDVVRAIEVTDVEINRAATASPRLPKDASPIDAVFDDALTAFVSVLDQHTLADFAALQIPTPNVASKKTSATAVANSRKLATASRRA
jgi:Rrf2 family protein